MPSRRGFADREDGHRRIAVPRPARPRAPRNPGGTVRASLRRPHPDGPRLRDHRSEQRRGPAAQLPGPEYGQGGNILISLRPAHAIVTRLLAILPKTPAGTTGGFNVHRDDFTTTPDPYARHRTPAEQALKFLKRPFTTYAEFRVATGPALDGWQEGGTTIQMVDYTNDGRYLIHEGERIEATPATADRIEADLQRLVDQATATTRQSVW